MLSNNAIQNALASAIEVPALIAGTDGTIVIANSAFCEQFGVRKEVLKGALVTDLSGCELSRCDGCCVHVALPGGMQAASMEVLPLRAGEKLGGWLLLYLQGRSDPSSNRDAMGYLQEAIDALPQGIIIWDDEDRLFAANKSIRAQCRPFGIEFPVGCERTATVSSALRAGVFGSRYIGLGKETEGLIKRRALERLPSNEVISFEQVSHSRWIRILSYFSPADWLMSFFEDVPVPDADEMRSAISPVYQKILLQYVTDFIVHIGPANRIVYVNDAFAQAIGRPAWELVGLPSSHIFDELLGMKLSESLKELTPEDALFSFDHRWLMSSGDFVWLRWSAHALFEDGEPVGVIATGRDISVEYSQQNDLKHQSEELEKRNKSLEQFAAVVSHDLKAPLRHISVFADMIVEEAGKGNLEELTAYALQVRQSAQRMDRVVRKLLEYSQIAYKIAVNGRVVLSEVTIQAIQNIEGQIEEAKAEVLLSKLPAFVGDPDLMRQVMQNLIANAVKYRRKGAAPRIRIYATETGSALNIFVEDNGIGIAPKFADTIFTAFQRLHRDEKIYDGFGIGLALCKQVVESHKGTIELDTTYSAGARFAIRLPRHLKLPEQ